MLLPHRRWLSLLLAGARPLPLLFHTSFARFFSSSQKNRRLDCTLSSLLYYLVRLLICAELCRPARLWQPSLHSPGMINYPRTSWYGLGYLIQFRGSVLWRCIPAVAVACVINWAALEGHLDFLANGQTGGASAWLAHPYTFQLVWIVFGYLMVTRINMSYSRYWEGVTMVKNMHSKWADACGQIISFDRSRSTECNLTSDPFCCHIVRLFSQMSAMATMRLHIVEPGESILFDRLEGKSAQKTRMPALSKHVGNVGASFRKRSTTVAPAPSATSMSPATDVDANLGEVSKIAAKHNRHDHHRHTKAEKIDELAAGISREERRLLLAAPCPVFATAQRIQRSIITRLHAGGMKAPPPIISRIFQEVSNGLLFYNNATKMKEVPVPFPYVQLNALLLNIFSVLLCPIAIASFTTLPWLSITTTALTVTSFYSVFIVANELEDPFGAEDNDMPMIEYHEEFCASLCALITNAWLPEDQWLQPEGRWVRPRNVALGVNAFCGKIGKTGVALGKKDWAAGARPYDSLLNRAKANRARKVEANFMPSLPGFKKKAPPKFPGVVVPDDVEDSASVIQRAVRARNAARMASKVSKKNLLAACSSD
jgi:predicted membrane chloride channel (bestrophin family)